jgi:hypothetical protein
MNVHLFIWAYVVVVVAVVLVVVAVVVVVSGNCFYADVTS